MRAMFDENGRPVKEAGPSIPVAVVGLSAAPEAGDEVVVLNDERKAKEIAEYGREKVRDNCFAAQSSAKLIISLAKCKLVRVHRLIYWLKLMFKVRGSHSQRVIKAVYG